MAESYFNELVPEAKRRNLPANWLPIFYELEQAAEGNNFFPDRSIQLANDLKWAVMSTEQLYGQFSPELRRIAAYRDKIDSMVLQRGHALKPLWAKAALVEAVYKRCNDGDKRGSLLMMLPDVTTYKLIMPKQE